MTDQNALGAQLPTISYPRPPAHIEPYVQVLGPALAVKFLLTFGGSDLYWPDNPKGRSQAEALIGPEKLMALGQHFTDSRKRVPTANPWLIAALDAEGKTANEIARTVRISNVSVRDHLTKARKRIAQGKAIV